MAKQPSFQFYPGDWMKDPDLRRCSLFARGLLADLLCVCFESACRGKLCERDGVTPWSDEDILRSVGENTSTGLDALSELLRKGVLSRDANGCVFSRRMMRDEELRQVRADAGHLGGMQNGSKSEANRESKSKQTAKQKAPPSSSSSASAEEEPPNPQRGNRKKTPIEEFNSDRRRREHYKPFVGERTEAALKAWIASHNQDLIPRDMATVRTIIAKQVKHPDELDFYRFVARIADGGIS